VGLRFSLGGFGFNSIGGVAWVMIAFELPLFNKVENGKVLIKRK